MARENFFSHTGPDGEHLLKGAFAGLTPTGWWARTCLKYNAPQPVQLAVKAG